MTQDGVARFSEGASGWWTPRLCGEVRDPDDAQVVSVFPGETKEIPVTFTTGDNLDCRHGFNLEAGRCRPARPDAACRLSSISIPVLPRLGLLPSRVRFRHDDCLFPRRKVTGREGNCHEKSTTWVFGLSSLSRQVAAYGGPYKTSGPSLSEQGVQVSVAGAPLLR